MMTEVSRQNVQQQQLENWNLVQKIEEMLTNKFKVICGCDNDGNQYDSITEMWCKENLLQDSRITIRSKKENTTILKRPVTTTNPESSVSSSLSLSSAEVTPNHKKSHESNLDSCWYQKSFEYWENERNAAATIDGMLGGYAEISDRDLEYSRRFVQELYSTTKTPSHALVQKKVSLFLPNQDACNFHDRESVASTEETEKLFSEPLRLRSCECGSGIGRVTKGLLLPIGFDYCDLVECSPRLIQEAPNYIGYPEANQCTFICKGLQEYEPEVNLYDLVWIQWVIGYLTDWDCVRFLRRMGRSLRHNPKGFLIIKDNTCESEAFVVDNVDSSLTRSLEYLLVLAELSGLRLVTMKRRQEDFPMDIFPVPMLAFEYDDVLS